MHHPTDRITHLTAFVIPVVEHWRKECIKFVYGVSDKIKGARCSSGVRVSLMARWFVGSILHGGSIELFLVQASAPRLV